VTDRVGIKLAITVSPEGEKGRRLEGVEDRVLSFEFVDNDAKADKLKLTLDNWDLANFDDMIWRKGSIVEATWGYAGLFHPTVQCVIQKVTGGQQLTVECLAKSILMHKEKKSRVFIAKRRADVAAQIAVERGFTDPALVHIEDTVVVYESIAQAGLTDAQLLAKMAKQEGFVFYVDWQGFHFHRRNLGQTPARVFHWYADPTAGDVKSLEIENDVTARAGSVSVTGRDPIKRSSYKATADNDKTKRQGLAPQPEVQSIDYAMSSVGEVSLRRLKTHEVTPSAAPNAKAAQRKADGDFSSTQLGTVKLKATIIGDPTMVAKSVVEWRGLGRRLSGNYYVKTVTHKIDSSGYVCDLECKRDGHSETGTPKSKAQVNTKAAGGGVGMGATFNAVGQTLQWNPTSGVASGGPNDTPLASFSTGGASSGGGH